MDVRPVVYDLCTGLHGWLEPFVGEGYRCVGFDISDMCAEIGHPRPDGIELRLRDITTIHGSELKDAALIVCSPPCQRYSYMAMPWSRAKAQIAMIEADETGEERRKLNLLFDTCFRLQREASEAAGHHIPMVVENVRGAQRWVGKAPYHYGSFYLWGDVPALMPITLAATKIPNQGLEQRHPQGISPQWRAKKYGDAVKVPGIDFNDRSSPGFNVAAAQRYRDGVKFSQSGDAWFDGKPRDKMLGEKGPAAYGSRSNSRKAASAMIAKIPLPLSQYIARVFKPVPR
jgi:hypothetical protein